MSAHVLARKGGAELVCGILGLMGACCSECGYGTRATSKRWARCKKCGHRVRRRTSDEVVEIIRGAGDTTDNGGDGGL